PAFEADYQRRLNAIAIDPKPPPKIPKSVGALIIDYKQAPEFTSLEPKSQKDYDRDLERLKPIEICKAADIRRKHVIKIRNKVAKASGARAADHFVSVVSALFRAGLDLDYDLESNPAHNINRLAKSESYEVWPQQIREAFEKSSPPEYLMTAYMLGRWLGLRASDIVRVGPAHRETDTIVIRCRKTRKSSGADAHASMSSELKGHLEGLSKGLLYVRREDGSSIDANALAKRMRKHLKSIGVVGYTVHGLRHLRGMELAEAGCSENEIMAQLGHVTPQMAAHYTKAARRKALSASAAKKLEQGERMIVKLKV
ncbi:MAG: site-specific integrase, partial [Proteobacteria bacterium]|nr:site-specific integrase [Pseudomonadota bacterium]